MNDINEKVLNILEKLEKQAQISKEKMEKYKGRNINEVSAQTQLNWMENVLNEYVSLKNIVTEISESLAYWAKEQMMRG